MSPGYGLGRYGAGAYGSGQLPQHGSLLDRYLGENALIVRLGDQSGAFYGHGHGRRPRSYPGTPLTDVGTVTIRHGRTGTDRQPDPATCSFTVRTTALTALPTLDDPVSVELGENAADWLGLSGADWEAVRQRFIGNVTDLALTPAGDVLGPQLLTVTAVSPRRRLGGLVIDLAATPSELDGARAARLFTAVAGKVPLGPVDTGAYTLAAGEATRGTAQDLLTTLATGTAATLAERRDGRITWLDSEHRRGASPVVTLTAAQAMANVTAVQDLAGFVNSLHITYTGGELTVTDPGSIAAYGLAQADLTLALANADEVTSFANAELARRAYPSWSLSTLEVDLLRTVDASTAADLLSLEHADLMTVTGLPSEGPFSAARLFVEGWTETISRQSWRLALSVSDYARIAPPPRWVDMDPAMSWQDAPPLLSWRQAAAWDYADHGGTGRWVDVPADQSWASTDPALTYT